MNMKSVLVHFLSGGFTFFCLILILQKVIIGNILAKGWTCRMGKLAPENKLLVLCGERQSPIDINNLM